MKVSKAIMAEDQVGATVEKTKLEESQRIALRSLTLFYILPHGWLAMIQLKHLEKKKISSQNEQKLHFRYCFLGWNKKQIKY